MFLYASVLDVERCADVVFSASIVVNVALLTIYDMLKAVDRSMEITDVRLLYKNGGKSGEYKV